MDDPRPTPSPSAPRPPAVLDASAFPHLLDSIIAHAPPASLLALRAANRACRSLADARLASHLILEDRGMGGRWFAAYHASLNPHTYRSALDSTFNAYSVYAHVVRLRVLGAPPRDTHYNWPGFVRGGYGSFTPGAGAYLSLVKVLDLVGDVGVLSEPAGTKFPHVVPLTRLIGGPSGEMEEHPPLSSTLALFPSPGDLEPSTIVEIYNSAPHVVINIARHDAPGLIRSRMRDLDGAKEVVISFSGWNRSKPAEGEGGGEIGTADGGGGQGDGLLLHGPETYHPSYRPNDPEAEDEEDDGETIPWRRMGPRENDNLRWQELAFLVALSLSCGARVTIVDIDKVDPAWLEAGFAAPEPAPSATPSPPAPPLPNTVGEAGSAGIEAVGGEGEQGGLGGEDGDTTGVFFASHASGLDGVPRASDGPDRYQPNAHTLRDLKATLRGLGTVRNEMPSFWLVNGLRVYGLCTVVMPASTRRVRFLSTAQYFAERRGEGVDARLELDAGAFAGAHGGP